MEPSIRPLTICWERMTSLSGARLASVPAQGRVKQRRQVYAVCASLTALRNDALQTLGLLRNSEAGTVPDQWRTASLKLRAAPHPGHADRGCRFSFGGLERGQRLAFHGMDIMHGP